MTKKKTSPFIIILIIIIITAVSSLAVYFSLKPKTGPEAAINDTLSVLLRESRAALPDSSLGKAAADALCFEPLGAPQLDFRSGTQRVRITRLDSALLCSGLERDMQEKAEALVAAAKRKAEVYTDDGAYLPEIIDAVYEDALAERLSSRAQYLTYSELTLTLSYNGATWSVEHPPIEYSIAPALDAESFGRLLMPVDLHYTLPDLTSPGPKPDPARFGETDDPAVISALLATETAQKLMNGQTTDWQPDKELIPGTSIHYYLDETILAIVWQEVEHGAVGTFSEVFIADASQLRRKIADDTPLCAHYYYPTELARQANAVVGLSADFYDHPDRNYGICVYDGKAFKYCLTEGETCCFTDSGDMLFIYPRQFEDIDAVQAYLDENRIMFSVSFGPVLIENGVDVTPYNYPLGEVLDTYARCCVGQLGERHYLSMTINCQSPDYYVYVTLRQAADSMVAHGCKQAYTLDGGQTGSIIIGGKLINPVQFGVEREMSDIFYFATAIPD